MVLCLTFNCDFVFALANERKKNVTDHQILTYSFIITEPLTIEQQCKNGATFIPHPSECQLYYNCNLRYDHVPRYFEQYMQECAYPKLFNTETKKCEEFEKVNCGKRKETKDGCK